MSLIAILIAAALAAAAYFSAGGRAIFGGSEQPDRLLGERVQLSKVESGPRGLDPNHPSLPPAVVENFDGAMYVLQFEQPVQWLGKTETHACVSSRSRGYPVSLVGSPFHRTAWVNGRFGSGEAFLAVLRRL